ncbi:hypothetical protein GN244_ATG15945 [Phytophthora infestans]|uniref:Uncharacterized protein n=1 Tax=Phytophthora infestans TaxID=4787 RepID=A0A833S449_PHYIN|nr:hypothetical protein GN244_ATG15945 [Phytophthora infestans]KAF4131137.1 hypothetical protein GN958_ATG19682 [Phytophthora infestans]
MDEKLKQTAADLKGTQEASHDQLLAAITSNTSSLQTHLQSRVDASQAATTVKNHRLEQDIQKLKKVDEEVMSRLIARILQEKLPTKLQQSPIAHQHTAQSSNVSRVLYRDDPAIGSTTMTPEVSAHLMGTSKPRLIGKSVINEPKLYGETPANILTNQEEGSTVLAALAQLNHGVAQLLANGQPDHNNPNEAIAKPPIIQVSTCTSPNTS